MAGTPTAGAGAPWRLVESGADDGYRNMAVDEALLESCAAGGPGFPCLRLYAFRPACLTLGFSQEAARCVDLDFCRAEGIDVARRPTGGRAVLHDDEITYAVVARYGDAVFGEGPATAYDAIARGLLAAFRALGLDAAVTADAASDASPRGAPVCFAEPSRHEIAASGWKIAGSAQARRRGAFLQHGSVPIVMDARRLAGATGLLRRAAGPQAPLPEVRGLGTILGRSVARAEVGAAIRSGIEAALGVRLERGALLDAERERAERLRAQRYLTTAWTLRR